MASTGSFVASSYAVDLTMGVQCVCVPGQSQSFEGPAQGASFAGNDYHCTGPMSSCYSECGRSVQVRFEESRTAVEGRDGEVRASKTGRSALGRPSGCFQCRRRTGSPGHERVLVTVSFTRPKGKADGGSPLSTSNSICHHRHRGACVPCQPVPDAANAAAAMREIVFLLSLKNLSKATFHTKNDNRTEHGW